MYDAIVIGAGIMGCASAYALSTQGKKTLVIEQFPLPHTRGSSHGASRITRQAYPVPFNAKIMAKANPMWRVLEQESGMELLRNTGMLCTTLSEREKLLRYQKNMQKYSTENVPLLDGRDISRRYPVMSFPAEETACFDPSGGVLYADKCLQAFQRVFLQNGGVIVDNSKVLDIIPGNIVTVCTERGDYYARGVILTCGTWSSHMLGKLGVSLPLEIQAVQVYYWKTKNNKDHSKIPAFLSLLGDIDIYGLPTGEYDDLVKICLHHGVPCDNPDVRDQVDAEREMKDLQRLKQYVASVFPNLIPEPAIKERCMYTSTPDLQCIVDNLPKYKNIAFSAGFSGHGFKQAPVIGAMLADLIQNKTPSLLADELRAQRFMKKAKL